MLLQQQGVRVPLADEELHVARVLLGVDARQLLGWEKLQLERVLVPELPFEVLDGAQALEPAGYLEGSHLIVVRCL